MQATNLNCRFSWRLRLALLVCSITLSLNTPELRAIEPETESAFVTGAALTAQLRGVVSVSWSRISLRQALASLSKTERVAIVLDRRVDPDRELQLALPREALEDILRKIAQQSRLGYSQLGPVAYFGPPETAAKLRTLAQLRLDEVRALPNPAARNLTQSRPLHWNDLAEPRAIVGELMADAHVSLSNPQQIPHDLWPAGSLPPMSWCDRLTLLLAEFDLTFEVVDQGRRVTLMPFPKSVGISRTYRAPRQAAELVERWSREFPQSKFVAEAGQVRANGLLEDHEAIERHLKGTPPRRPPVAKTTGGKEVYQVTIDNAPLNQVLDQLAERLSLEFQWDREAVERARIARDQLVSIKVSNADADTLLRAVFDKTGLAFERRGRTVRIFPSAAPRDPVQ